MDINKLAGLQIFEGLTHDELAVVDMYMNVIEYPVSSPIFERDDPGGTMFVVVSGLVEINALIGLDLEKALANVPPGAVFGELSLFTLEPRSARAITVQDSVLLSIDTPTFERMLLETPALGSKILRYLTTIISDRLRNTTDMYRQALEWSLSVSGAMDMHFEDLITNDIGISMHLSSGQIARGQLVKVDQQAGGQIFLIRNAQNKFQFIPYHAITAISFDSDEVAQPQQQKLF